MTRAVSKVAVWVATAVLAVGCASTRQDGRVLREDTSVGPSSVRHPDAAPSGPPLYRRHRERRFSARVGTPAEPGMAATELLAVVPRGWPELEDDQQVLGPFLACAAVAQFLELQATVDMVAVVERLEEWSAVRLGAVGPLLSAEAGQALALKRYAFLRSAGERYGPAYAEVFLLFLLHSAYDDEVRELLRRLAAERQLARTLGPYRAVSQHLARRGLPLSSFPERGQQAGDVVRGLGRAASEALGTSPVADGARYLNMSTQRAHLPPPYQRALEEQERALSQQHLAPGSTALGGFDSMTFGVPLGFYHLLAGTTQGLSTLAEGELEEATYQLAPAMLLVSVYAGGKGMRAAGARVSPGTGTGLSPEAYLRGLREAAERLREQLGQEAVEKLARYLQASREAAVYVGAGGERAAMALYEAGGNVPRAQAMLSKARPGSTGAGPTQDAATPRAAPEVRATASLATLVDTRVGHTAEVLASKLRMAELESAGARLSGEVAVLERQRPVLEAPPLGLQGNPLWGEYVTYFEGRLQELKAGSSTKAPLTWLSYERMRGVFARGLAFERFMVGLLREDAALPRAQRRWLQDFNEPRIETNVGMTKDGVAGIRYADVLIIENQPPAGQPPRVETLSFKSRNLAPLDRDILGEQVATDARDALRHYAGEVNILRKSLRLRVRIQRVRLVYEGGDLKPRDLKNWKAAVKDAKQRYADIEVLLH
ncbi:MAG TPA: hypothetical protein VK539_01665 [Myxococcaceae bacterium]|nr:hypothetical protein [Myxococcaceae bacterium]